VKTGPQRRRAPLNAMDIAYQALAAQQRGELTQAIALYRRALEIDPDLADALHMLGVALMQQFEPLQALEFIAKAADLTDWQIPAMRHNYGWALSVLMSARPSATLPARAAAVASARQTRAATLKLSTRTVTVLALCESREQVIELMAHLRAQSMKPAHVVALLPAALCATSLVAANAACEPSLTLSPSELPHSAVAMARALRSVGSDYVQLVSDPVSYAPARLETMVDALHSTGARWGFSRATLAADDTGTDANVALMLGRLNGLDRLQHRLRLGDLLVERSALPISLSNLMYERDLLIDVLSDSLASPPTPLGFSLASVWRDEPQFVNVSTLELTGHTVAARHSESEGATCQTMMQSFVERILQSKSAPNPLAPNLGADGVDVLKRALRGGLGSALNQQQLVHIAHLTRDTPESDALMTDGIEFIGFARAESGLGENLRSLVRATATTELGKLLSVSDIDIDAGIRNSDTRMDRLMNDQRFRTRVICVNPDMLGEAFHHDGFGRHTDAYRIGFWFWELERLPRMWVDHAKLVDEIWVATDFVAEAVRRDVKDRPVIKIRTPVNAPLPDRAYTRAEFGLRDDCCLFMFSFAYGSFSTRKNPEAVIHAFRRAFPVGNEQAQLIIKTSQSEQFTQLRDGLVALAAGDNRITFINGYLSRAELTGLQSTIDCYVSLHRSEGLGLGLAECMAAGKPAIATAYSGNLEFMNADNSFLVDYRLVPVSAGEYPDYEGQVWAEASVEHAATHMRSVYTDRARAAQIGLTARLHLQAHFNDHVVGEAIAARYQTIQRSR
jgi:glycosyltransferase involved in cell wall biosynthesis